jgi:hypothetical protein
MDEPLQFRITACCSNCLGRYDATKGLACPACKCPHPKWATREEIPPRVHDQELSPYPHCLNDYGTACHEECPACHWVAEQHAKQVDAKPEIEWLDKLFALEDTRCHTNVTTNDSKPV